MKIKNDPIKNSQKPKNIKPQSNTKAWVITRRVFLRSTGLAVTGLCIGTPSVHANTAARRRKLHFGIVTDAHFADVKARGVRHYRESAMKMNECVTLMNEMRAGFLIELGDFKDQGNPASEKDTLKYLDTIEKVFRQFKGARYHVLGNHDLDSISKQQFMVRIRNTGIAKWSTYYSFDSKEIHFVVLDANYNADESDYDHGNFDWTDSNITPRQIDWLRKDLACSNNPVIVFIHQQLDGHGDHTVRNATEVRKILQESKKVLAVFQGHNHAGHYSHIEGIHYYTLKAMVDGSGEENNAYAMVEVYDDYSIVVTGYRKADGKNFKKA